MALSHYLFEPRSLCCPPSQAMLTVVFQSDCLFLSSQPADPKGPAEGRLGPGRMSGHHPFPRDSPFSQSHAPPLPKGLDSCLPRKSGRHLALSGPSEGAQGMEGEGRGAGQLPAGAGTSCLLPVPTPCLPSAVHQGPTPTGLAGSLLSERLTVASLRSLCLAVRRAERPVAQLTAQPSPLLRYQPSKAQRTFSRGKPLRVEGGERAETVGRIIN